VVDGVLVLVQHQLDLVDLVVVQDEILGQHLVVLQPLVKVIMEEVNKEIVTDLLVEEEELGKLDIADGLINMLETKS
jgi:DNA-directed RNA polymerase subunit H (RpoH/RPB5)